MSRKNLSDVNPQDLLLKWQYEGDDGHDIYAVHTVADYLVTSRPLGTLSFNPRTGNALLLVRNELKGCHLQATGPEGEE
jgi:hypothetical protein